MVAGRAASGNTISTGAGAGSWVICAGHRRIVVITLGGLPPPVPAAAAVATRMMITTPMSLLLRDIWRNPLRMVRTNEYTQRPTVMLTRDRRPHTVRLRANARLRSITRGRNPNIGTVPFPLGLPNTRIRVCLDLYTISGTPCHVARPACTSAMGGKCTPPGWRRCPPHGICIGSYRRCGFGRNSCKPAILWYLACTVSMPASLHQACTPAPTPTQARPRCSSSPAGPLPPCIQQMPSTASVHCRLHSVLRQTHRTRWCSAPHRMHL